MKYSVKFTNGFYRATLLSITVAVALTSSGCTSTAFPYRHYYTEEATMLTGVETGEPTPAKSLIVKGWAEVVPRKSSLDSGNVTTNHINPYADAGGYSGPETVVVTQVLPRERFGLDFGVAVTKRFSVGGSLMLGYGYGPSAPDISYNRYSNSTTSSYLTSTVTSSGSDLRKPSFAGGFWVSTGSKYDSTFRKPRVRYTFRLMVADRKSGYMDRNLTSDTGYISEPMIQAQPNFGLQLPLNKHMAAFTGFSFNLTTGQTDNFDCDGCLIHGGITFWPIKYLSIKPMVSYHILSFTKRPIPLLGLYASYDIPFSKLRGPSEGSDDSGN